MSATPLKRCLAVFTLLVALAPTAVDAAPEVRFLFPAGAQRGQSVEVTAGGKFSIWPVTVQVSRPGVEVSVLEDSGKLSVQVADDASPGLYWLRLYDATGAAPPKPFIVGPVSEVVENETNDAIAAAQAIDLEGSAIAAATVNGQLGQAGDVDVYALRAKAGQTLVADLDAHRELGSTVDAVLQLVSPDGFVYAQNDDQLGIDPRLAIEIPSDGVWYLRVFGFPATPTQAIRFAGNPTYVYRLTIGTAPFVDYTMPMASRAAASTELQLHGWNLPDALQQMTVKSADLSEILVESPLLANSLQVPVLPGDVLLESEPNSRDAPQEITLPSSVTGRMGEARDHDAFSFNTAAGEIIMAKIESRELGFDLDPVLELIDAEGKQLVRVDDAGGSRDAELVHTAAADGPLRLVVSDLHREGGPRFVYRLAVERGQAEYRLKSDTHQVAVAPGGAAKVPIAVERLHGFKSEITVTVSGLPDGVTAAAVSSQGEGDTAAKVTLVLQAAADAQPVSAPVRILGQSGDAPEQQAIISVPGQAGTIDELWLTVTAKSE